MAYRFVSVILLILALGTACKRAEVEPNPDPGAASDQAKFQAMWEKTLRGTPLSDLPVKYQARTIPDKEKGEIFQVFSNGNLLRTVQVSEFGCEEELHHLKKRKVRDSCAFLPFLEKILGKRIESLELVGKGRDYVHAEFGSSRLRNGKSELVAFVNKQGEFRVEERPVESFFSDEEAAKGGDALQEEKRLRRQEASLAEARKRDQTRREGKKYEKRRRRSQGVRNAFKTRSLYWVDVYETDVFPEQAGESSEAATSGDHRRGTGLKSPGDQVLAERLTISIPGKVESVITLEELGSCPEEGCSLADLLPESFAGEWCISSPTGTGRMAAAALRTWLIRARRQGGLVIKPPTGTGGEIRNPTSIMPCE